MFKLISWNIQQGGGSRIAQIVRALVQEKATCLVLSEFKSNESGQKIRSLLLQAGYKVQMSHAASGTLNSVLIASLLPADTRLHIQSDSNFPNAIIEAIYPAFSIFGVYLPHKKKHKLFPYLVEQIEKSVRPVIIAGDFNSGINGLDQKGDSFWYSEYLKKMDALNCHDAFRKLHGNVKEYSWYSHQGNGYRYDHTYCSADLFPIIKRCYYLHEWREKKLSDHSPMVLEMG